MAWYDDKKTVMHLARYKDERTAAREMPRAAAKGWVPQTRTIEPTRVAVGKTIRNAVLTAGFSLLNGNRVHKSGVVTITWVRSPTWHATPRR